MNLGIRVLLLVVAFIVFVAAIFVDDPTDWWSIGFACLAAAFIVSDLGWDRPIATTRRT